MTKTYAQIVKQIEVLKEEADRIRRKEVDGVIGRIRGAIVEYGLTAEDLGFSVVRRRSAADAGNGALPTAGRKRGRGARGAAKSPAVVKFRNEAGQTWGGRGKRPQWLRDALTAGRQLADFAVK